jgi:hypothetical protein
MVDFIKCFAEVHDNDIGLLALLYIVMNFLGETDQLGFTVMF